MELKKEIPEFGIKRENEERRDGGCGIVFDPETQLYAVGKQESDGFLRLFSGGVDENEDTQKGVLREVTEESGLHDFLYIENMGDAFAHYYNSLRKVNRIGKVTCFLIILKSKDLISTKLEEHEKFSLVWKTADEIFNNWAEREENNRPKHWIYFFQKSVTRIRELGFNSNKNTS